MPFESLKRKIDQEAAEKDLKAKQEKTASEEQQNSLLNNLRDTHNQLLSQIRENGGLKLIDLILEYSQLLDNGRQMYGPLQFTEKTYILDGQVMKPSTDIAVKDKLIGMRVTRYNSTGSKRINVLKALVADDSQQINDELAFKKSGRPTLYFGADYEIFLSNIECKVYRDYESAFYTSGDVDGTHLGIQIIISKEGIFINGKQVSGLENIERVLEQTEISKQYVRL